MSSSTPETDSAVAGGLLAGYRPPVNSYDELRLRDGGLREPWPRFVSGIERLGSAGLDQRREQARRLLRENGVTYNVYGDPRGLERPWQLDPIPLLIAPSEADVLAEARERVGRRELSAYVNEALRRKLAHDRLGELLARMEAEHGPIPEELIEEAEQLWRPAGRAPRSRPA